MHPESYAAAKKLLELLGYQVKEIGTPAIADLKQKVLHRGLAETAAELEVGVPTLQDIMEDVYKRQASCCGKTARRPKAMRVAPPVPSP